MAEYCDRCHVARARYRIWISRYGPAHDLVLCSHHFNDYEEMILLRDYEVDELDQELVSV